MWICFFLKLNCIDLFFTQVILDKYCLCSFSSQNFFEIENLIPNYYSAVFYSSKVPEVYKINLGFNCTIS